MNILFLTQIIPYPPDAGPKVKTWNVIRYLEESGHHVTLVSFIREEEKLYLDDVKKMCSEVHVIPIKRSRLADVGYLIKSQLTGRSFLIERDNLAAFRLAVKSLLANRHFDVIHADQLTMSQFALDNDGKRLVNQNGKGPILIFDAHNAVWTIVDRMGQTMPFFIRPFVSLESRRIKHYEGQIVQKFDRVLAVTEQDRLALIKATSIEDALIQEKLPITVIPIAVDTSQLRPINRKAGSTNLITLGTLHYPPNADGIRWFVHEIYPLISQAIPEISLTIIGKNPPQDFSQFNSQYSGSITVTGYVPDLVPYLEQAAIMVVPVRAGGGMRVRILEAFSRAMPVVTTTIGIEGIDATPDLNVIIEDDPQKFASAVVRLIKNEELQAKLAENGRRLAESQYDWRVVLDKLNTLYKNVEL